MRKYALFVALLLLVSLGNALWKETANILVEDQSHRPVPHAKVTVTWQLSERDAQHQSVGYTDYMGLVSFNLTNLVQLQKQEKNITNVLAEYGAGSLYTSATTSFDIGGHPDPVPVTLPLYRVKINLLTPYNWPVKGALVYIAPWTLETDSAGSATFLLPWANTNVVAVIGGAQTSKTIHVRADTEENITMGIYRLTLRVVDQNGNPRTAVFVVGNTSYPSDYKGVVKFTPFLGSVANMTITSGDRKKNVLINMTEEKDVIVAFDFDSPVIKDLARTTIKDDNKMVVVKTEDEGRYASGLDSVTLFWSVNGQKQPQIEMYPRDATTFAATLPAQPNGTSVSYYIRATDKEGNSVSSEIESYDTSPIVIVDNGTANNTNQTSGGGFSVSLGGINWWVVIGIGVVFIIAIVAYIYIRGD